MLHISRVLIVQQTYFFLNGKLAMLKTHPFYLILHGACGIFLCLGWFRDRTALTWVPFFLFPQVSYRRFLQYFSKRNLNVPHMVLSCHSYGVWFLTTTHFWSCLLVLLLNGLCGALGRIKDLAYSLVMIIHLRMKMATTAVICWHNIGFPRHCLLYHRRPGGILLLWHRLLCHCRRGWLLIWHRLLLHRCHHCQGVLLDQKRSNPSVIRLPKLVGKKADEWEHN